MVLIGKDVPEKIWNYLITAGLSKHGAAGLMGNLEKESGLNPENLENLCERRLKEAGKPYCTDKTYTAAVDSGQISRAEFLYPLPGKQYGYARHNGLPQAARPDIHRCMNKPIRKWYEQVLLSFCAGEYEGYSDPRDIISEQMIQSFKLSANELLICNEMSVSGLITVYRGYQTKLKEFKKIVTGYCQELGYI